jgi:hypothetical protein
MFCVVFHQFESHQQANYRTVVENKCWRNRPPRGLRLGLRRCSPMSDNNSLKNRVAVLTSLSITVVVKTTEI